MTLSTSNELLNGWLVLVVDDEPDSLTVATVLLELCGAQVITARDGQEGLELARRRNPNFIISDLSMPRMSGWQMLQELQFDRRTADIPVIALTAHAMDGDRNRAIGAGFHNYLTKPLQPEMFVSDLLRLLIEIPEFAVRLSLK
jgi:CheY-like chemotaxis protein